MSTCQKVFKVCLILAVGFCAVAACQAENGNVYYCGTRVIGYYPNYRNVLSQLKYGNLTNVTYFSLSPFADGGLDESNVDIPHMIALVDECHANGIEVSICVGGWGRSGYFPAMAADADARANFGANLLQFCIDYELDGVDLDWEPVSTDTDRNNYSLLVQELDDVLEPEGLLLTVAVASFGSELRSWAFDSLDWIGVMAYDMGTPHSTFEDSVAALEHWESMGAAREKLVLGVPFYGRKPNGDAYTYSYIINTYNPEPDVDEVDNIYFNGITTIKTKTEYVMDNGYGGIMIWEVGQDTFDETSLLVAIGDSVLFKTEPDYNCDGEIDIDDFSHLSERWLEIGCDNATAWCEACDRDQSGDVELGDVLEFINQWLR